MQTYQCLKKEAKTSGKVFLTASAGTGKTFAIEHVVTRKILEGCRIEQILVVTFTREATRSLKRRIHETLLSSVSLLQKKGAKQAHRIEYLESYCPQEAKKNALRALSNLDQAQIFTIHGFCLEMLNSHSLMGSLALASQSLDKIAEGQSQIDQAIFSLLRRADLLDFSYAQKKLFIEQSNKDLHKLMDVLKPLLFSKKAPKQTRGFTEIEKEFKDALGQASFEEEKLLMDLEKLKKGYKGLFDVKGRLHNFFSQQVKALAQGYFDEFLIESKNLFSLFHDDNKKANCKLDIGQLHYPTLYFQKAQQIAALIQEARDLELLNHRFCTLMKEHFDQEGSLFYADKLLTMMAEAIEDPVFFKRVSSSFKAVIVDEFQDTDELQYNIFKRLFFDQKELFFCVVGDEKQSIYAFRGADLNTFQKAKEDFIDCQYRLESNFRSSKGIVGGLERLFHGFASQGDDDVAFDFHKVHAMAENVKTLDPSLEFFVRQKQEQEELLEDIYERILELKKEYGFTNSSFVFLVKDRYQAEKVYDFLKSKGGHVDALIKDSIFNSSAFLWVMLLLEFIEKKSSSLKKALLIHPMVGIKAEAFESQDPSGFISKAFDELDTIERVYEQKGLYASFQAALKACLYQPDLSFEETLIARKMMQEFFDLKKVMQLVLKESLENALLIRDLREKLHDLIRSNRLEPQYLKDVSSSSDAILIMTQHASKGLEFDVVIAIGLMLESSSKKRIETSEAVALDQEKMRLFYVSLTRAKQKLLIPCTFRSKLSSVAPGRASAMDLFIARKMGYVDYAKLYERVEGIGEKQVYEALQGFHIHRQEQKRQGGAQEAAPLLIRPKGVQTLQYERQMQSFSSLVQTKSYLNLEPVEDDIQGGKWFGSLVHQLLEKILSKGFHNPFNEKVIQELIERYLKFTPLKKEGERLFDMIQTTLHKPIEDDLRLLDVKKGQMHQEACFLMNQGDNIDLKGFVDLVFFHNQMIYIIDYKTHHLANYSKKMCQAVVEHYEYDKQMQMYQKAVSTYMKERSIRIKGVKALILFVRARKRDEGIIRL